MIKYIFPILILIFSNALFASSEYKLFEQERLSFLTFRVADPDYLSFELGFLGRKNFRAYPFYSYAGVFLANKNTTIAESVEGETSTDSVRCAMMSAKGGVVAPVIKDIGIMAFVAVSLGITAVSDSPWFGHNSDRLASPTLLAYEIGMLYQHKQLVSKITYNVSNLNFLPSAIAFSFGVNF